MCVSLHFLQTKCVSLEKNVCSKTKKTTLPSNWGLIRVPLFQSLLQLCNEWTWSTNITTRRRCGAFIVMLHCRRIRGEKSKLDLILGGRTEHEWFISKVPDTTGKTVVDGTNWLREEEQLHSGWMNLNSLNDGRNCRHSSVVLSSTILLYHVKIWFGFQLLFSRNDWAMSYSLI